MSKMIDSPLTEADITAQLAAKGIFGEGDNAPVPQETKTEEKTDEPKAVETQDSQEETKEEAVLESSEEVSTTEQEAMAKGWKPDGVKSAEEFLRAEPLYEEIKSRGKEIKELKETLDALKSHMDKQQEVGYKKALDDLKEQRIEAIQMGDVEAVDKLDSEIADHTKQALPTVVESFQERNKTWLNDPSLKAEEMRQFMLERDNQLAKFNLSESEHIKIIEQDLREKFVSYFEPEGDVVETKPAAVESGKHKPSPKKKAKFSFDDLSPVQKQCARRFNKSGVMSVDQYIQSLIETGELQ